MGGDRLIERGCCDGWPCVRYAVLLLLLLVAAAAGTAELCASVVAVSVCCVLSRYLSICPFPHLSRPLSLLLW